ncbi:MAG: GNAT family N-acetyltransferase [Solirubrobacteraceae bacterium]
MTAAGDYTDAQLKAWAPGDLDVAERACWAHARTSAHTIVAVENDGVAGFSDLVGGTVLDMLYVDPEFGRRGLGSALITEIVNLARSGRAPAIKTAASLTARPVFERHGFAVVTAQTVVVRGVAMTNFKMRLALDRG